MNRVLSFILLLIATPIVADEMLFVSPQRNFVNFEDQTCPEGMLCLPSNGVGLGTVDTNVIIPEWAKGMYDLANEDDHKAKAYIQGLSDGYIVDICNYCGCCTISSEDNLGDPFEPWSLESEFPNNGNSLIEKWQ